MECLVSEDFRIRFGLLEPSPCLDLVYFIPLVWSTDTHYSTSKVSARNHKHCPCPSTLITALHKPQIQKMGGDVFRM